jgi:hypothetical protein
MLSMLASALSNGDLQKKQAPPWKNMSRSRRFVGMTGMDRGLLSWLLLLHELL